jgi:hypothetical protein
LKGKRSREKTEEQVCDLIVMEKRKKRKTRRRIRC